MMLFGPPETGSPSIFLQWGRVISGAGAVAASSPTIPSAARDVLIHIGTSFLFLSSRRNARGAALVPARLPYALAPGEALKKRTPPLFEGLTAGPVALVSGGRYEGRSINAPLGYDVPTSPSVHHAKSHPGGP